MKIEVEAIGFKAFLALANKDPEAHFVDGVPWNFTYKNIIATHEHDTCYIVSYDEEGYNPVNFTPEKTLLILPSGKIKVIDKNLLK